MNSKTNSNNFYNYGDKLTKNQTLNYSQDKSVNYNSKDLINSLWDAAFISMVVLVILIHTSTPVSMVLKATNGFSPPILGAIWYFCGLLGLIIAFTRPMDIIKCALYGWPFVLINIWVFASVTWSISPSDTFKAAMLLTMSQMTAFALASRYSWFQLIRLTTIILTSLIFLSVLLAVAIPKLGQMQTIYPGAWSGLWTEKQGLGFASTIQVIFAIVLGVYYPKYRMWLLAAPLGIIAILGTEGKTALIMIIYAIGAITASKAMQLELRLSLILALIGVVFATLIGTFIVANPDLIFKLTGKSNDLTGRKEIWEGIDFLIQQRPDKGWGYGVIWNDTTSLTSPYQWIAQIADFKPANAHSSYRETLLTLGKYGLYLLVLALGKTMLDAVIFIRTKPVGAALCLGAIGSLITISFTEMVFLGRMDLYWLLVVMIGTKLALPNDEYQENQENLQETQTPKIKAEVFTY